MCYMAVVFWCMAEPDCSLGLTPGILGDHPGLGACYVSRRWKLGRMGHGPRLPGRAERKGAGGDVSVPFPRLRKVLSADKGCAVWREVTGRRSLEGRHWPRGLPEGSMQDFSLLPLPLAWMFLHNGFIRGEEKQPSWAQPTCVGGTAPSAGPTLPPVGAGILNESAGDEAESAGAAVAKGASTGCVYVYVCAVSAHVNMSSHTGLCRHVSMYRCTLCMCDIYTVHV